MIQRIGGQLDRNFQVLPELPRVETTAAVRDGDWKYLRNAGNEFLFNIVADPRERANLKRKHSDVFERLKTDFESWDATMLPESKTPVDRYNSAAELADHYGVSSDMRADMKISDHY